MTTVKGWPTPPTPHPLKNSSDSVPIAKIIPGVEKTGGGFSSEPQLMPPVNTGGLQVDTRWQVGVSGNPKGRPKGSRNRFSELFMKTLVDDFASNGEDALAQLRTRDPEVYFRLIVALLPKSLIMQYDESCAIDENMTEEEFIKMLNDIKRRKFMQKAVAAMSE